MSPALERRLLQAAVTLAGFVPVSAGAWGALGHWRPDSHARYLSGLLLGIGLAFWATVPAVERRGVVFRTLAAIVVIGGLARLLGVVDRGLTPGSSLPLVMELAVTPFLAVWRERVAKRLGVDRSAPPR